MAVPVPDLSTLFEQKITQRVTVTNGTTGTISLEVPNDATVFVKGYGYTWYDDTRFRLATSNWAFPWTEAQEGSLAQPLIWARPYPVQSGFSIDFLIENNGAASITVDLVIYILTNRILQVEGTGGEIVTPVSGSGGVPNNVTVYNAAGTVAANVTTKGLEVEPQPPATIRDGTLVLSTTAAALSSSTALKRGVFVQNPSTNTINAVVGNATSQNFVVEPGQTLFLEVDNLATVYVKSASGTPTINYLAT